MKRFKNWNTRKSVGSHFGPGLCAGEGCVDRRWGQNLDKWKTDTASMHRVRLISIATSERYRRIKAAFPAYKRSRPLLTYWESKESYFLSEEPQLTVREETEKKSGK